MRTACIANVLAAVVGVAPAAFAQDPQVADRGKFAGTGTEAKKRQAHQTTGSKKSVSLAVPIGRISVDRGSAGGEPVYVRRSTVREGITIVEVSTTPFAPVLAANEGPPAVRSDQPASW